jgi:hypothetical protein
MQTDRLPVVELRGTSRERGRAHGEALREPIARHLALTKEWLAAESGADPDRLIADFLSETDFGPAIDRWTPGVRDEIAGIAEGSDQPRGDVFTLSCVDELWWYVYYRQHHPGATPEACSSLGVVTDNGVIIGQTMDLPSYTEGCQALLRIIGEGEQPDAFAITLAGTVACYGVNRAGVGICCNTLMQLDHDRRGLPVACVVRGVLGCRTFGEAARFVESVPHASGQNYLIGDPREIASFESGAGEVARYWPLAGRRRVYHTNHPLVNRATGLYARVNHLSEADVVGSSANSSARLAVLDRHLRDEARPVGLDDLREILSSREDGEHPVCRLLSDPGNGYTAATLFYELSADPPVLHLAAGPLLASELRTFSFDMAPEQLAAADR